MRVELLYPIVSTSVWGIAIVGAKIVGNAGFNPVEITFGRFFLATLIFIPLLFFLNFNRNDIIPKNRYSWLMIFGLSLSGVAVNNSIFYFGLSKTTASMASMIVSLNPIMTMLFAVLFLNEKFSTKKIISVILGIIGISIVIGFDGNFGQIQGNLLILIAVTIWGSSFTFSKKASENGLSAIAITGWSEIIGTIFLSPSIFIFNTFEKIELLNGEILNWFIFLGVLSSVIAYIIHYQAISIYGASKVAPSVNIIPISGVITAYFILGENISLSLFLGGLIVMIGVFLVQFEK